MAFELKTVFNAYNAVFSLIIAIQKIESFNLILSTYQEFWLVP